MNTYRVVKLSDIDSTNPIHICSVGEWVIENTVDGYYATSFITKERADAVCKSWNETQEDPP